MNSSNALVNVELFFAYDARNSGFHWFFSPASTIQHPVSQKSSFCSVPERILYNTELRSDAFIGSSLLSLVVDTLTTTVRLRIESFQKVANSGTLEKKTPKWYLFLHVQQLCCLACIISRTALLFAPTVMYNNGSMASSEPAWPFRLNKSHVYFGHVGASNQLVLSQKVKNKKSTLFLISVALIIFSVAVIVQHETSLWIFVKNTNLACQFFSIPALMTIYVIL